MNSDPKPPLPCPNCGQPMELLLLPPRLTPVAVYVCRPCNKEVAVLADT